jgi:thioredoxin 1
MAVTSVNQDNYQGEVESADLPVIMDFWAEWCGPCQMMGPVFEELSEEYSGRLKFVKINVGEAQELASKFGVRGIPTLVIVKGGEEASRIVGFLQKEELKAKIDEALSS